MRKTRRITAGGVLGDQECVCVRFSVVEVACACAVLDLHFSRGGKFNSWVASANLHRFQPQLYYKLENQ